jgi:hypothetical protein
LPGFVAFLADHLKSSPTVVGIALVVLGLMLLAVSIKCVRRYFECRNDNRRRLLERRSDNGLIEKLIDKSTADAAVIEAIRGTAIAAAATATASEADPDDADVDGVVRRVVGWMRDLKLPPGG